MRKLIYSALVGTLAFALSVQAAEDKGPKKKGRGAEKAEKAQGKVTGQARANMQRSPKAAQAQAKVNHGRTRSAMVRQDGARRNGAAAEIRRSEVNNAAVRNSVKAERRNAKVTRTQNAAIASQQNAVVTRQQNLVTNPQVNLKRNRNRQVAIVNNWSGSTYSAPQYSAFQNYRRVSHDRNWYQSRYSRFAVFGGGNYYWDNGYWFPAWGYNSGYRYGYDGPIYGYNNLDPYQVVVNVQAQLQRNGYYPGAVDGSLGPMTRRALASFQADQGLPITSAIDRPTLEILGLS